MPPSHRAPLALALALTASCVEPPAPPPATPAPLAPAPAAEPPPALEGRIFSELTYHGGREHLEVDVKGRVWQVGHDWMGLSVRDATTGHLIRAFSALGRKVSLQLSPDGQSLYSLRSPLGWLSEGAQQTAPLLLERWSFVSGERVAQVDVGEASLGNIADIYRPGTYLKLIVGPRFASVLGCNGHRCNEAWRFDAATLRPIGPGRTDGDAPPFENGVVFAGNGKTALMPGSVVFLDKARTFTLGFACATFVSDGEIHYVEGKSPAPRDTLSALAAAGIIARKRPGACTPPVEDAYLATPDGAVCSSAPKSSYLVKQPGAVPLPSVLGSFERAIGGTLEGSILTWGGGEWGTDYNVVYSLGRVGLPRLLSEAPTGRVSFRHNGGALELLRFGDGDGEIDRFSTPDFTPLPGFSAPKERFSGPMEPTDGPDAVMLVRRRMEISQYRKLQLTEPSGKGGKGTARAILLGTPSRMFDTLVVWSGPAGKDRYVVNEWHDGVTMFDLGTNRPLFKIKAQDMGVLPAPDGSLWTIEDAESRGGPRFLRRYDAAGNRSAEYIVPRPNGNEWTFVLMGWVETGKKLWYVKGASSCVFHLVTLPGEGSASPTEEIRQLCDEGTIVPLPGERFLINYRVDAGTGLYRSDGTLALRAGTVKGEGFAFAPDGRFACTGRGCEMLRCLYGGESFDAGHKACKDKRVDGFDPEVELAKSPR